MLVAMLWAGTHAKCTDQPACFKKGFFKFGMPDDGLYPVSVGDLNVSGQAVILGYGDFNNDLYNDILVSDRSRTTLQIFTWDQQSSLFTPFWHTTSQKPAVNAYLLDCNYDGMLDIVLYHELDSTESLLVVYLHQGDSLIESSQFRIGPRQPFLGDVDRDYKTDFVVVSRQMVREVLFWENHTQKYQAAPWTTYFTGNDQSASLPFSTPHFSMFADLSGDCLPDFLIMTGQKKPRLELYIQLPNSAGFKYSQTLQIPSALLSLSLGDLNYDGKPDLAMLLEDDDNQPTLFAMLAAGGNVTKVCDPALFKPDFQALGAVQALAGDAQYQQMHMVDMDYNGFLDILLVVGDKVIALLNKNNQAELQFTVDDSLFQLGSSESVLAISPFDILEDGIIDYFVEYQSIQHYDFQPFLNNSNKPSLFFLKAHGLNGALVNGSLYYGASFGWKVSTNEGTKYVHASQLILSAYLPKRVPFTEKGLGRAITYAEDFTGGLAGTVNLWTPIIPNSQLIVQAGEQTWVLRAFIRPTEALLWVIVVSLLLLAVLGAIMAWLYFKEKEEDRLQARALLIR